MYCPRCGRTQPPLPRGVYSCVYCSAALPVMRWRATVPPGVGTPTSRRVVRRPYLGPPTYRGRPPRWGFPTVAWRAADLAVRDSDVVVAPIRLLGWLAALAWASTAVALLAAGAETWRFVLVLRNRTLVLADGPVRVSNALVAAAGWTLLAVGVVTAVLAAVAVVRAHAAAARRLGLAPARPAAAVLARLVIPGWNVFGAGQMLAEVDGLLARPPSGTVDGLLARPPSGTVDGLLARPPSGTVDGLLARPPSAEPGRPVRLRLSGLVAAWWLAWVADAGLAVAALVRAFGRSPQAIADTIELHIAVDVAAALVAGLLAVLAQRFRIRFRGGTDPFDGWQVAAPAPTSERKPVQRKVSVAEDERSTESTAAAT